MDIARTPLKRLKKTIQVQLMPQRVKRARAKDKHGLGLIDPGIDAVTGASMQWIFRAQDCSSSKDGGVASHYSLVDGWCESYPETTGYIVPTVLNWYELTGDVQAKKRAIKMLDWFVKIQFPEGGFQGSTINASPCVPVTFNTGQILLGLAAGTKHFGDKYANAMHEAARWLCDSMDDDGAWRKHPTPFAKAGEKSYETHVAWSLLEADRVAPNQGYAEAAVRNIKWAISKQLGNGWFTDCCLGDPAYPLTHTIGYVMRGILEGWRFSDDQTLLNSVVLAADALLGLVSSEGELPGRLNSKWLGAVDWVCLTGSAQIAHCFLMLYEDMGDQRYLDAACALNKYVRRSVLVEGDTDVVGGVKGSFPIYGAYAPYRYLNWAAKFTIDSNLLEREIVSAL